MNWDTDKLNAFEAALDQRVKDGFEEERGMELEVSAAASLGFWLGELRKCKAIDVAAEIR